VKGFTLDAGALIAWERRDRTLQLLLDRAAETRLAISIPAGALAQVWRDGRKQARLARLLATEELEVVDLDELRAREAGALCGARNTSDVIDASVVLCARARDHQIITSNAGDLRVLDPDIELIEV
jgi:hypothetical protein